MAETNRTDKEINQEYLNTAAVLGDRTMKLDSLLKQTEIIENEIEETKKKLSGLIAEGMEYKMKQPTPPTSESPASDQNPD